MIDTSTARARHEEVRTSGALLGVGLVGLLLAGGALGSAFGHLLSAPTGVPRPAAPVPVTAPEGPALAAAQASLAAAGSSVTVSGALLAGPTGPNWTAVVSPMPTARWGASLVYDGAIGAYLLFGGATTGTKTKYLADTWELSTKGVWTPLNPKSSPTARAGAGIAYDAADKYVVLFGGTAGTKTLGATWKFAAGTWTKLAPATHPPALSWVSMTYDAHDGYAVLFGGETAALVSANVTWTFLAGSWTKLTTPVAPSPRFQAGFAYDANDLYGVLFGGSAFGGPTGGLTVFGDTWTFSGGVWTPLAPSPAPPARAGEAMAYSPVDTRVVLFGGLNSKGTGDLSDSWTFTGGNWTKHGMLVHPSARTTAAAADGPSGGSMTLFGGYYANPVLPSAAPNLNDTWITKGTVWKHTFPVAPAARYQASMAYDESDGYVLLFGGFNLTSDVTYGDTWTFAGGIWTPLTPLTAPAARAGASMTYDQADGYVLLFAGGFTTSLSSDTWAFHAGKWTEMLAGGAGSPPARGGAGMTYDAADGYVLLFGGMGGQYGLTPLNDTWEFLGGAWSLLSSASAPVAQAQFQMTYDSEDGYVLCLTGFEGALSNIAASDTWVWTSAGWTNITSLVGTEPQPLQGGVLVDDTYDGYVLLFGGTAIAHYGVFSNETWSYNAGAWTHQPPLHSPSPRTLAAGAFDVADQTVVINGGDDGPTVYAGTYEWTG